MARKYAAPFLQAICMDVARAVAEKCVTCGSGVAELLCESCNAEFIRRMDNAALQGAKRFVDKYYDMALERISEGCDTCFGDGRIHLPWGKSNDWSAMVLCADKSIGLRLGEIVIPGRDICIIEERRGIVRKLEQYAPMWHYSFNEAMGAEQDALVDLGAHPDDGERWECPLSDFDAIAFMHKDQIVATMEEHKRPKAVDPLTANHAGPQAGYEDWSVQRGIIIDIEDEYHTEDVVAGSGLIVASRNTTGKARKRLYRVLASNVDGVLPGNSVVVMRHSALIGGEVEIRGRRLATIQLNDILCKGEVIA